MESGRMDAEKLSQGAAGATEKLASAAHEHVERVVEVARPAVDRAASMLHETVDKVAGAASQAADRLGENSSLLKDAQSQLAEDCRLYLRDHPVKTLALAAAAGFVLSRLMRS